jgi:hypothetical protein
MHFSSQTQRIEVNRTNESSRRVADVRASELIHRLIMYDAIGCG